MKTTLNPIKVDKAHKTLRAVFPVNNKKVLDLLFEFGEMNVQQIEIKSHRCDNYMPQSCVSLALSRLLEHDWVKVRDGVPDSRWQYYSINYEQVEKINKITKEFNDGTITRLSGANSRARSGRVESV